MWNYICISKNEMVNMHNFRYHTMICVFLVFFIIIPEYDGNKQNMRMAWLGNAFPMTGPLWGDSTSYWVLFFIVNTLRPRQDGCYFPDDIFRCIFLNENIWIAINISLSFVPKGPIDNISALVQIMAWRWSGDKPLSEPMMVSLLTHICVTQPQWVNRLLIPWFQMQ